MIRLAALASLALLAPLASADVRVVDAAGGGDFTDLQSAVDAAAEGDVLLVRTGTYPGFTIDDRSLSVVADPGAEVEIAGTLAVAGLTAGAEVLVAGLAVTGVAGVPGAPALTVDQCRGALRFQDCAFEGGAGLGGCFDPGDGGPGARLTDSIPVVFTRCALQGGGGYANFDGNDFDCSGGDGAPGGDATGSVVVLYECDVRGGGGGTVALNGGTGAPGLRLADFGLFAAGTSFTGGEGGDAFDFIAAFPGDGDDGLLVEGPAIAILSDCTAVGGDGGHAVVFPRNDGDPGDPIAGAGTVQSTAGPLRRLESPVLAPHGGFVSMTVHGVPGDRVYLPANAQPGFLYRPDFEGVWLLRYPTKMPVAPLAVIDGSGSATVQVPVDLLGGAEESRLRYLQVYVIDAVDQPFLGTPAQLLALNCDVLAPDCNGNASYDACDLLLGASTDCDINGIPDECQTDCNGNAVPDTCDLAAGTSTDVNGNGIPDECEPANQTWHVDAAAAPGGDGSVASPFQALGEAFAIALTGDTILVADGTYTGASNRNLAFGGRDLVVRSANGPDACVIDLQGQGRAFMVVNGESAAARIEGFTIVNGAASQGTGGNLTRGGGIRVWNASPVIADCTIAFCTAHEGGGLSLLISNSLVVDCRIGRNTATNGGGLYSATGHPIVTRCLVGQNHATNTGGGIAGGSAWIRHCTVTTNTCDSWGGGIAGGGHIDHCLVVGNRAARGGGIWSGTSQVYCSTIVQNDALVAGGGFGKEFGAAAELVNCILWSNVAPNGPQVSIIGASPTTVTIQHSTVQGGQAAVHVTAGNSVNWRGGNLTADPQFVDPAGPDGNPLAVGDNDYRLSAGSPALDAGHSGARFTDVADVDGDGDTSELVPLDLDLLPRLVDDPAPNTGAGTPPVLDQGAYERQP